MARPDPQLRLRAREVATITLMQRLAKLFTIDGAPASERIVPLRDDHRVAQCSLWRGRPPPRFQSGRIFSLLWDRLPAEICAIQVHEVEGKEYNAVLTIDTGLLKHRCQFCQMDLQNSRSLPLHA
jgi:hypothetical protein